MKTSLAASEEKSSPVGYEETIARLIAEVKAGRELVQSQREQIASLEKQIEVEQANAASLSKSYVDAQREITQLRTATAALERAINLHEQTIEILKTARAEAEAKARKANKRAGLATVIAVVSLALKLL